MQKEDNGSDDVASDAYVGLQLIMCLKVRPAMNIFNVNSGREQTARRLLSIKIHLDLAALKADLYLAAYYILA